MATPKLNYERAARALADEVFIGQRRACEKAGIAARTLRDYRQVVEKDEKLAALRDEYIREAVKRPWADELSETLTTALRKIGAKIETVEADNLTDITHLVGLTRELMELELSRKYAEHETRGDDRADDLGAQQTQGAARQAQDSRLLS